MCTPKLRKRSVDGILEIIKKGHALELTEIDNQSWRRVNRILCTFPWYCNLQIGNPARTTPVNRKLKPELRGVHSAIYTPPFSYPSGNGKPHLHIIKRSRNVTLLSPPRSFDPKLGLGDLWVRQLRSGSCHCPTLGANFVTCKQTWTTPIGAKL